MSAEAIVEQGAGASQGRVAKNAVIYMVAQLVSWCVSFLSVSIIPRRLGEAAMGHYALASTILMTTGSVYALSIDKFLVAEIGRDRQHAGVFVQALWGLRILLFLPMVITVCLVMRVMQVSPLTFQLGLVGLVAYGLLFLINPVRSMLAGWEEAKRVSAIDFVSVLAPLLAIPFLIHGPVVLLLSNTIVNSLILCWLFFLIRGKIKRMPTFDSLLWRKLIHGGQPFLMNDVVSQLSGFVSIFLLRHFVNESAVGEFSQTLRLQGTFLFVPVALGYALLPSLARLADADAQELRRKQSQTLALMFALALPVATLVSLLADPFCHLLYGANRFRQVPMA